MYIQVNTSVFLTVPQPTVSITPNRTGVLYAGTPLTLTCSIQLNPAVDTTVMVTRMWRGPASQVVSNSSHVSVSNILKRSAFIYETTIQFSPLNTVDGGNYECEATVTPDPQSQFVIMSTAGSDTHPVTVQGEYCYIQFEHCYFYTILALNDPSLLFIARRYPTWNRTWGLNKQQIKDVM